MRIITLLSFLLLVSHTCRAQKFFARASATYAWPLSNSRPVYMTGFPYTGGNASPDNTAMFEVKNASMFSGFRLNAGAGFMFSRLGFDLGISAVPGKITQSVTTSLGSVYPVGSSTTITQTANSPLMVIPSMLMKVPGRQIDIFLRAGIALPVSRKIFVEAETIDGSNTYYDKTELKTKFGLGLAFSGGVEYKITRMLRVCAAIEVMTLTLKAMEQNLLESTINGQDVTSGKFAYEKKTMYSEDLSGYTFSSDQPRQAKSFSLPFGSKGFSLGLCFEL